MDSAPHPWVIVAAAGAGTRFGGETPKPFAPVGGAPLLHHTLRSLAAIPALEGAVVVVPPGWETRPEAVPAGLGLTVIPTPGGEERTDSVACGLSRLPPECRLVLVHDGARPLCSAALVDRVMQGARAAGACVPVWPAEETVKEVDGEGRVVRTLDRSRLGLAQTPQGFRREVLERAYAWRAGAGAKGYPDDAALVEASGQPVRAVPGEPENLKVTRPGDLARAGLLTPRVGFGYDVHRLAAGRRLVLGGVPIPHDRGLAGHSDADVVLHALMDALLGAAGLPDIGVQFPNTDPAHRDASSLALLAQVVALCSGAGFAPASADLTILAERPKVAPHVAAMRAAVAKALGVAPGAVGVKATTGEGLGFAGREEGIAAWAVAVLRPVA